MNKILYTFVRNASAYCKMLMVFCLLFGAGASWAAAPTITSVSVSNGTPGVTSVTIIGTGFNDTASRNTVYFGATMATITSVPSTTLLTVIVPTGALHDKITVTNLNTRLSVQSVRPFAPVYDTGCFIPNTYRFKARADYALASTTASSPTPYASAIGDLDGDGLADLVVCTFGVVSTSTGNVSILHTYRNTSVNGVLSYAAPIVDTMSVGGGGVKMADLDGDGRLDVIITCNGSGRVSLLRNYSTLGSIALTQPVNYFTTHPPGGTYQGPYESAIADYDGDGRLDIAVVSQNLSGVAENEVEIFRNIRTTPIPGNNAFPYGNMFTTYTVDFPLDFLPFSIYATDFDGDSKPDLAVSNFFGDNIYVFRNNSALDTFIFDAAAIFNLGSGSGPLELDAQDFDGDGKPDISVVTYNDNKVNFFRNTATPGVINLSSFTPAGNITLPAATGPTGMTTGDFDGDGKLDIVASNNTSNNISVLRNVSSGSSINFTVDYTLATGVAPVGVTVGDVDGDTKPDIVVACNGENSISVFEHTQSPDTFSIAGVDTVNYGASITLTNPICGSSLGYWGASNINASVTGSASGTTATVTGVRGGFDTITRAIVYLSDTAYVRHIVHVLAVPVINTVSVLTGIPNVTSVVINGAIFNDTATRNIVMFGATMATVTSATASQLVVTVPYGALHDYITITNLTTRLSATFNKPFTPIYDTGCFIPVTDRFKPAVNYAVTSPIASPEPYDAAIGDMDGDGLSDLVVCTNGVVSSGSGNVSLVDVYRNTSTNGVLSYAAPVICTTSVGGRTVKLADLDNDGLLDIVVACAGSGRLSIVRNISTLGTVAFTGTANFATDADGPYQPAVADFDGDGKMDIAIVQQDPSFVQSHVEIFRNIILNPIPGNNPFSSPGSFTSGHVDFPIGIEPASIAAADFDGDKKVDIVVSNTANDNIAVLRNISVTDNFIFQPAVNYAVPAGSNPLGVQVADFNHDGKIDICVANFSTNKISVFQNNISTAGTFTAGSFTAINNIPAGTNPIGISVGDMDGDGRVDIAVSNNGGTISVIKNNVSGVITAGSFGAFIPYSTGGTNPIGISVGDLDGDTKSDIVVVNNTSNNISVFEHVQTPDTVSIRGIDSVCMGVVITLSNNHCGSSLGYWSATNSHASVAFTAGSATDSNAVVTGVTAGTDTIVYAVVYLSDTNYVKKIIRVLQLADTGIITGPSVMCAQTSVTLNESVAGGVWSTLTPAIATVDAGGVVTALSAGAATILYTTSSLSCGPLSAHHAITVNTAPDAGVISGASGGCVGTTITLTSLGANAAGAWFNYYPAIATHTSLSGLTDTVTGIAPGIDTIIYVVNSTFCGFDTAFKEVGFINSVSPTLPIAGAGPLCVGDSLTLSNGAGGGTWSTSTGTVVSVNSTSGVVIGLSSGSATVSYNVSYSGCGSNDTFVIFTVNPLPVAGTIVGATHVCSGGQITLSNTTSFGSFTWSSSDLAVSTVTNTGVVTGVAAGADTIFYTVTNGCGTVATFIMDTVITSPNPGTISGPSSVCVGATINMIPSVLGGTWTTSNTVQATIGSPSGTVTGLVPGNDTAIYTVTSVGCGNATATKALTVNATPAPGTILGSTHVCIGTPITLTNTTSVGTVSWRSSNPSVSTVSPTGVVTGMAAGNDTIFYVVTTASCGSDSTFILDTVKSVPNPGTISFVSGFVCPGTTTVLTNPTGDVGGVWSSATPAIATINAGSGAMTAITGGTAVISYTVANFCGADSAGRNVTITPYPDSGTISGTAFVCVGSQTTLNETVSTGTWSSGTPTVATISASGVVGGVATGTSIISYTVTNFCGTAIDTMEITVNPAIPPSPINATQICQGASTTLTTAASGGTWVSSAPSTVTVTSSGMITGLLTGTATITYSISNACSSTSDTAFITVNANPNHGTMSGPTHVCAGAQITLTNTGSFGTPTWRSTNLSVSTVTSSGVVTGVAAGVDSIIYTVTTPTCGSDSVAYADTVIAQPNAGNIVGAAVVCQGTVLTLTNPTGDAGGTWGTAAPLVATITSGGVATALIAGSAVISYTVTNICNTASDTALITVNANPNHGTMSGPTHVCAGAQITLTNTGSFGTVTWRSTNLSVSTVTSSGVVTGVAAGVDSIIYTVTTPTCGSDSVAYADTVIAQPNAGNIVGAAVVCQGTVLTLTNPTGDAGGTWGTAAPLVATITSGGVATALIAGSAVISYTVTNICNTSSDTALITVNANPNHGTMSGPTHVCAGAQITLTNTGSFGTATWRSTNLSVSTVTSSGVVTGVAAGVDSIIYTVTTPTCGSDSVAYADTVIAQPVAGNIVGAAVVCQGTVLTLTNPTGDAGGTWGTNAPLVATITSGGVATALSSGSAIISYTATNVCNSATDTALITVNPLPDAGTISGFSQVCIGATITLTSTVIGGTWSSTNAVATVGASSGDVNGVHAGSDSILYTVTTATCGAATDTFVVTVDSLPVTGVIVGSSTVCVGALTSLTDAVAGGVWSTSNNVNATINATGVVSGVIAGTDTAIYTTTNLCGSSTTNLPMTVLPLADADTIHGVDTLCIGASATLTDPSSGGVWSITNPTRATITATGVVTAIFPGVDTVYYIKTNTCNTDTAMHVMYMNPLPNAGVITGPSSVCVSSSITLSDTAVVGGTFVWSSSNTAIATVSATGVVFGVSADTTVIHYTFTNFCGIADTTDTIVVRPLPFAANITGVGSLCVGASGAVADTVNGGVWSIANPAIATITTVGAGIDSAIVTGLAAGTAIVRYVVTNSCGSDTATYSIVVNPIPALNSSLNPPDVCSGTLFHYVPSSLNPGATFAWSRAVVPTITNAANTGTGNIDETLFSTNVLPVDVIYAVTTSALGCSNTQNVTVKILPVPTLIGSLSMTACSNSPINYLATSGTPGTSFAWTRAAVAGINPTTGSGSNFIFETLINTTTAALPVVYVFTLTANGCTNVQNLNVTVERQAPAPPVITTTSPSYLCSGTMYQNFGAATVPPAGVTYGWTSRGAEVWATGSTRQYCLVNFDDPGLTWVILSASYAGFTCTSKDSFAVLVNNNVSENPEVFYLNPSFVCAPNTEETYQWGYDDKSTLDSTLLKGETNQGYINDNPDFSGKYYWCITTNHGCSQKTYYKTPTGIQNVNGGLKEVTIYPNPNNGVFEVNVVSDFTEKGVITVTNIVGEKVMEQPFTANTKQQLTVDQAAGIYFVTVITPYGKFVGKVIITR